MELTNRRARLLRRITAVVVGVEALAIAVGSLLVAGGAFNADAVADVSVAVAFIGLVIAVPLGLACRALWHGRTWPRGLVVTWQVMQVVAGVTLLEIWLVAGVMAIVLALVAAAAVIADTRASASFGED